MWSTRCFFLFEFSGEWSILETILAPTGFWRLSPNRSFLNRITKQNKQKGPRNVWKNHRVVYWFLIPKRKGLKGKSERLAEELLQNRNVQGVMKSWENGCLNGYQKQPKSKPKSLQDQIAEILVRLGGIWNLEDFGEKKKRPNIQWKSENWRSGVKRLTGTAEEADPAEASEFWSSGLARFVPREWAADL